MKNIKLYYVINFLTAIILTGTIWSFFFTSYLNFSFGEALFLTIFSGIISFIFEIPSGAWVDKYGRKKLFLIGLFLIIISLIIWLFSKNFYIFLISGFLNGIGYAIMSGNIEASIHDYLEENGKEKEYNKIQSNGYISLFLGKAFGSLIAGYLFVLNPLFPIYGTIIAYILAFIATLFIREAKQELSNSENQFNHIKKGLDFILKNKLILILILVLTIEGGLSNIYRFTYQPYLNKLGFSIENIGIIFAIISILSAIGSKIIKILQDNFNEKIILNIIIFVLSITSILFGTFDKILGIIGIILLSIQSGFIFTFANNFLIHKSPKTHKSTILSIFSFSYTIGYTLFSIISGFLVDLRGLEFVYIGNMILIFILSLFTIFFTFKNKIEN